MNAASWSETISPGSMIAIFGSNLAASQASAAAPLPATLAGTSVTINGLPAPLSFVSPGQINAQAPSSLTTGGYDVGAVSVVVTTAAGSGGASAPLAANAAGFFTADGSGCGQAAALNIRPDGAVSLNSPSNSAAPGDYIALFGTGFGLPALRLDDGIASSGPAPLSVGLGLRVDGTLISLPSYTGLAPGLTGVDQVNFQVPIAARNGCAVPVTGGQTIASPSVTLSIQSGRGQCTDPPIQSSGQIVLSQTTSGITGPSSSFGASFPAGPQLMPTAPETIIYAPSWGNTVAGKILLSAYPFSARSCAVPGYTNLSAGAIRITSPTGILTTVQPFDLGTQGVSYGAALPQGFVGPGTYTITGDASASVNLNATVTIGAPIQILTPLQAGTQISTSQPLTVAWTGGQAGTLVRVSMSSPAATGQDAHEIYTYANAQDGSLTIPPFCTQGKFGVTGPCGFGVAPSEHGQIRVEVMPDPAKTPAATVPGITGTVQLTWLYIYNFSDLVLTQ